MIVAYDLRFASDHFTGIGTHARCLLQALLDLPGPERYAVLWNPRLRHERYDVSGIARHPRVDWHERNDAPLTPWDPLRTGAWLRRVRPALYLSPFYLQPFRPGCPTVLTIHDVWPLRLGEGLSGVRMLLYRASLERARAARLVITSSEFSRREIIELVGVPTGRVRAVRLGVPYHTLHAPVRPGALTGDGPFALVVGDNRPRKNLETLARAWAAHGEHPPLRLVSAGPVDPRYLSLPEFAARHGARDVIGLGWVGEPELEWLYRNAKVVLFPSRYEGFGFPLVEAYARGCATIAADIPTLREIGEGATRFVPADDAKAWRQEILDLLASPASLIGCREAGRRRASELTYEATAKATLRLLRGAAGVDSFAATD